MQRIDEVDETEEKVLLYRLPSPEEAEKNLDRLISDHLNVCFKFKLKNCKESVRISTLNTMAPGSSVYQSINYQNVGCYCYALNKDPTTLLLKECKKKEMPLAIVAWNDRLFFYNQNVNPPRKPYLTELIRPEDFSPETYIPPEDAAQMATPICIDKTLFDEYLGYCKCGVDIWDPEKKNMRKCIKIINELKFLETKNSLNDQIDQDKDEVYPQTLYTEKRYQRIVDRTKLHIKGRISIFCYQEVRYDLAEKLRQSFSEKYDFVQSFRTDAKDRRIPDELLTFYDKTRYKLYGGEYDVELIDSIIGKELITVLKEEKSGNILCIHNTHGSDAASIEELVTYRKQRIKEDMNRVDSKDRSQVKSIFIGDMNQGVSNAQHYGTAAVLERNESGKREASQYTVPYDGAYISNKDGGIDQLEGVIMVDPNDFHVELQTMRHTDESSDVSYTASCPADNHIVIFNRKKIFMSQYVAAIKPLVDDFNMCEAVPCIPYNVDPKSLGLVYGIKIKDADFEKFKADVPQQKGYAHPNKDSWMFVTQKDMPTFYFLLIAKKIGVVQDEIDRLSNWGIFQSLIFWRKNPILKIKILRALKSELEKFLDNPFSDAGETLPKLIETWMNSSFPEDNPQNKTRQELLSESRGFFKGTSHILERLESHHILPKNG